MGKTKEVVKKQSKTSKKGNVPGKKAKRAPKPHSRYLRRPHANLLRARFNIVNARSKEVDTFNSELLHKELNTVGQIALLQAGLHKRSQVTTEDMAYAQKTSRTALGVVV